MAKLKTGGRRRTPMSIHHPLEVEEQAQWPSQ